MIDYRFLFLRVPNVLCGLEVVNRISYFGYPRSSAVAFWFLPCDFALCYLF